MNGVPDELVKSLDFDELMAVIAVCIIEKIKAEMPTPEPWWSAERTIIELMAVIAAGLDVETEDMLRHAAGYMKSKAETQTEEEGPGHC